jgi:hypothetical protein
VGIVYPPRSRVLGPRDPALRPSITKLSRRATTWRPTLGRPTVRQWVSEGSGTLDGMCGRYASTRSRSDLLETFKIEEALADEEKAPDYNVAPTKTSPTVLARAPRDAEDDAEPVRQLRTSNGVWCRRGPSPRSATAFSALIKGAALPSAPLPRRDRRLRMRLIRSASVSYGVETVHDHSSFHVVLADVAVALHDQQPPARGSTTG